MEILAVDHTDPDAAAKIFQLMQLAYKKEAELIGVEDFPPLRRTVQDIQGTDSNIFVLLLDGDYAGAVELEVSGAEVQIASLVVRPQHMRKGLGAALVRFAIEQAGDRQVLVQTDRNNDIAIALYEKLGFQQTRQFATDDGFELVELRN